MKGFFGLFNDTIFQLMENDTIQNHESKDSTSSVRISEDTRDKRFGINIKISNISESMMSNKDLVDNIIKKVQDEKILKIKKLSPLYRMTVDYQVYDKAHNVVIDEAVVTKNVDALNTLIPLGLDPETNELVYRVGKTIDSCVSFMYNDHVPYGIMVSKPKDIYVYINRIQLQQCASLDDQTVSHHCQPIDTFELTPSQQECVGKHPVSFINSHARRDCRFTKDYVVIYDSVAEGLTFNPIKIDFDPRKINIYIYFTLNNYAITSEEEDILKYVDENNTPSQDNNQTETNPGTDDKKDENPSGSESSPSTEEPKKEDSSSSNTEESDKSNSETSTTNPSDNTDLNKEQSPSSDLTSE